MEWWLKIGTGIHEKFLYVEIWIALLSLRHEYTEKWVVKEGRKEEEEEEKGN